MPDPTNNAAPAIAANVSNRLERALDVLSELAEDETQSGAVRARSAAAIVSAGVTLAKIAPPATSAGELTVTELEDRIEQTRKAIQHK